MHCINERLFEKKLERTDTSFEPPSPKNVLPSSSGIEEFQTLSMYFPISQLSPLGEERVPSFDFPLPKDKLFQEIGLVRSSTRDF